MDGVPGPGDLDPALLADLVSLAEGTAREAAVLVAQGREGQVEVLSTKSTPTDVVTRMDHAAEELIRRRLGAARPQDVVHGEEGGAVDGVGDADGVRLTWLVDPIDGTVNYLYGIPAFAVSIAVVAGDVGAVGGWHPLAGCVVDATTGVAWTATVGGGARRDGVRVAAAAPPRLDRALVGTGFGYDPERRRAQARVLTDLLPRVRDLRRIGSAALDLCAVADGRLDVYYERGLNPWDMAAGMLVVAEAGGRVSGLRGLAAGPDMLVAGVDPLHGELRRHLERLAADRDLQPAPDDTGPASPADPPVEPPAAEVSPRPAG